MVKSRFITRPLEKNIIQKKKLHFIGVTHQIGLVDGDNVKTNVLLRHQPQYNNTSWSTFFRKLRHQVPVHAKFFFPPIRLNMSVLITILTIWLQYISRVKKLIIGHIIFYPF